MDLQNSEFEVFYSVVRAQFSEFHDVVCMRYMDERVETDKMWAEKAARIVAALNAFKGCTLEEIAAYGSYIQDELTQVRPVLDVQKGIHFSDCQCDQCTSMVKGN